MQVTIVLWLMTLGVDAKGLPFESKWGAVDSFATVAECKAAARSYGDVFEALKKNKIIGQAKCLPAGTQP